MQKTAIEDLKRDHTLPQRRFTSTSTSCSSDATPQILVRNTTTKENTNELEAIASVRPEAPPATAETATAIVQSTTVQAVVTAAAPAVVSKAMTNTTTNNDGNTPLNSKSISPAGSGSSDPIIPATRIAATVIKAVVAAAPAVASKSVIEVYRGRPTERIVVEKNSNKSDDNDNDDDDDATNWSLGWTKITNRRANQGHTNSRKDSYWITPKLKYRLRSVLELHHFVTALNSTKCNGDEELAKKTLELYKKKKKTTASKKNNKTSCNNRTERALVATSSSLVSSKPSTITPLTKKKKNKTNSFNNNNNSNNKVERKVVATSLSLISSKPSKVTSPTEKKKKRKKTDTSNKNSSTSSKNKVERAVGVIPSSLISKPTKITSPTGISLVVTPTDRDIYQDTSGPASSALQHFYVLVETHYDKFHGGKNESEQNKVVDTIFYECATKFKYRFLTKKNEVMPQQYAKKKIVSLCTSSYRLLWKFSL